MKLKEFINLSGVPEFSIGVIGLVALIFDLIPKLWIEIIWFVLLVMWLINMVWLEPKYKLIKEYNLLMISYTTYSLKQTIDDSFKIMNPDLASHQWSRKYFDCKQADIDRKFKELHNILTKSINCRYYLIKTDTALIGSKYAELVGDTETLYGDFHYSIDYEFISALKNSRDRFPEIKNAVPENLLSFSACININ